MDNIAEIILDAFPWLEGFVDTAYVYISALPGVFEATVGVMVSAFPHLVGWVDTATVVVTATPFMGLPVWLYGVLGAGFLTWTYRTMIVCPDRERKEETCEFNW